MLDLKKVAAALALLRHSEEIEKLGKGLLGGAADIYKSLAHGAREAGTKLTAAGHPILGGMAALAPAAGVGYLGYKAYQSQPVQQAIYNYRMRKAQQQAMQQGYY